MAKYNILLADDFDENLSTTKDLLQRWGYSVDTVTNGTDAIEAVRTSGKDYAVGLLDFKMPGMNGAEAATQIRALNDEIIIVIYSAFPTVESLTATIRAGGLNFVEKSEDVNYLRESLARACEEFERTRRVKPPLEDSEISRLIKSIGMIGNSEALARVAEKVIRFRTSSKPVLILGETGSGKEMVAKALHNGPSDKFFVINCAAFQNSSLVEAELFGHEKGSFTGAIGRKAGILEAAKGGTIYLDELHYLDMQTQGKLLRALREKKIRRVGGLHEESVDFRLVASSWPNIEQRVKDGTFLPDLYYRLKFLSIEIPPLRDRPEDIEALVYYFCNKHFTETGERKSLSKRAIRFLERHDWPGNVGELDGYLSGLLTECRLSKIEAAHLGEQFSVERPDNPATALALLDSRYERERRKLIIYTVQNSDSIQHAAERLGMKASSLHTLLTRMGLRHELITEDAIETH